MQQYWKGPAIHFIIVFIALTVNTIIQHLLPYIASNHLLM
jgi:hypothetical protein